MATLTRASVPNLGRFWPEVSRLGLVTWGMTHPLSGGVDSGGMVLPVFGLSAYRHVEDACRDPLVLQLNRTSRSFLSPVTSHHGFLCQVEGIQIHAHTLESFLCYSGPLSSAHRPPHQHCATQDRLHWSRSFSISHWRHILPTHKLPPTVTNTQ